MLEAPAAAFAETREAAPSTESSAYAAAATTVATADQSRQGQSRTAWRVKGLGRSSSIWFSGCMGLDECWMTWRRIPREGRFENSKKIRVRK